MPRKVVTWRSAVAALVLIAILALVGIAAGSRIAEWWFQSTVSSPTKRLEHDVRRAQVYGTIDDLRIVPALGEANSPDRYGVQVHEIVQNCCGDFMPREDRAQGDFFSILTQAFTSKTPVAWVEIMAVMPSDPGSTSAGVEVAQFRVTANQIAHYGLSTYGSSPERFWSSVTSTYVNPSFFPQAE